MKRRSGRFEKIVTLAAAAERSESVALGRARRALDEAVDRLGELERYRHEYAAGQRPGDEVSAVRWADFQAFLGRLDEAVNTQRQVIRDGEQSVDRHRRRWMIQRTRLDSLYRVLDGYRLKERLAAERRQQRALDDRSPVPDLYSREPDSE